MKLLENRAFGKSLIKGTRGFAPRDETFPKFQAPANQAFGKGLSEIFDQAFFQKACFDKTFSKSFKDLPFICSLLSPAGFVISPENQLIKTCARSWATKEEIERSLRPDLDWDYILDIAIQENIAPLLFYNLEKVSDGLVAPGTMEYLRVIYFAIAKAKPAGFIQAW